MAVSLSIEVNDAAAQRMLTGMIRRSQSFIRVFDFARELLEDANAMNFSTGGLPVGGWAPRRGEMEYGWAPLVRTGRLAGSLTNLHGPPNVITPTWAEFGTDVEYAKFHQYGTTRMPARKIVFEPYGFAEEIGEAAASHIVRGTLFGR